MNSVNNPPIIIITISITDNASIGLTGNLYLKQINKLPLNHKGISMTPKKLGLPYMLFVLIPRLKIK